MRMIYGHGYAQIGLDSDTYTEFPYSIGYINYREEFDEYTSLSGVYTRKSKGYRAEIEIEIFNVLDNDWLAMRTLFEDISYTKANGLPIWVRPRFESGAIDTGLVFETELVSDINLEDLAKTASGQRITLVFRAKERTFTIPTNVNNVGLVNWQDENGNNYTNESAVIYTITA